MKGIGKKWVAVAVLILLIFCFSTSVLASSTLLRLGSRGEEVRKLQRALIEKGFLPRGEDDGIYGPKTRNAVIQFQRSQGIQQDGIAGPITLSLLYKNQSEKAPSQGNEKSEQTELDRGSNDRGITAALVDFALQQLGKPYVYAAAGPNAFDCSGFTTYVYKNFGVILPRTAKDQGYGEYAPKVGREDLKPGDLVFFNTNPNDSDLSDHAGIYIGDGKFIHASSSSTIRRVIISSMDSGYYQRVFSWGRRVFK